jgi:CubicO group peptidase (beta-lactamase class C family)
VTRRPSRFRHAPHAPHDAVAIRIAALDTALLAAALVACIPSVLHAQKPAAFDAAWQGVTQRMHRQLDEQGIVGGALWFVWRGDVLAREFHGFADVTTQRRVDEHTIFHWASITKTFTGIAVMQLRDRGLLSLDDPIVKYVPELRAVHNPFGSMDAITIRQLMSHSAGFRSPTWPWGGGEAWHPHEPTEWSQLVAMMPYTEILFDPGSRYSYSNPGVVFLGRTIELLTGDDFEVYIDKNILKPLGMYRSYFDVTPYHLLPFRSDNYTVRGGERIANGLDFDTGITTSNGGLNAPVTDMAEYLAFLVGDGSKRAEYDVVLRRSSLEEMWRVVLPVTPEGAEPAAAYPGAPQAGAGMRESIGLSFFVLDRGPLHVIGHTGSQKAFQSFFYVDPATGAAAIAAFNTDRATPQDRPDMRAVLYGIRGDVFDRLFPLFR